MVYWDDALKYQNPNKDQYDEIPVYYCKDCLSLKVNGEIENCPYCEDCNNTSIAQTDIHTWERLYQEKYGYSYLKGKPDLKQEFLNRLRGIK